MNAWKIRCRYGYLCSACLGHLDMRHLQLTKILLLTRKLHLPTTRSVGNGTTAGWHTFFSEQNRGLSRWKATAEPAERELKPLDVRRYSFLTRSNSSATSSYIMPTMVAYSIR
jgi:hypothetical protein